MASTRPTPSWSLRRRTGWTRSTRRSSARGGSVGRSTSRNRISRRAARSSPFTRRTSPWPPTSRSTRWPGVRAGSRARCWPISSTRRRSLPPAVTPTRSPSATWSRAGRRSPSGSGGSARCRCGSERSSPLTRPATPSAAASMRTPARSSGSACSATATRSAYTLTSEGDELLPSEAQLRGQLVALMGGRAAEALLFVDHTGGASNDFEKANQLADAMVTQLGSRCRPGDRRRDHRARRARIPCRRRRWHAARSGRGGSDPGDRLDPRPGVRDGARDAARQPRPARTRRGVPRRNRGDDRRGIRGDLRGPARPIRRGARDMARRRGPATRPRRDPRRRGDAGRAWGRVPPRSRPSCRRCPRRRAGDGLASPASLTTQVAGVAVEGDLHVARAGCGGSIGTGRRRVLGDHRPSSPTASERQGRRGLAEHPAFHSAG